MAQLAEQLLLTPEVRGSNTAIDNFYSINISSELYVEKMKIKKKRTGMAYLKKLNVTCVTHANFVV